MKRPRGGPSRRRSIASTDGRCWPPNRSGRCSARVAPAPRVDLGLDRRRRRREHDRDFRLARAHHRHVARVVAHAVLLLVGGVVLLIDDDQAEIGVGQKQRRARADHDRHLALGDRRPGARALARRRSRECHSAGRTPKRSAKRSRNCAVSAISGIRISTCLPAPDRLGHRLEIDLGLARAGDAVDQRRPKTPPLRRRRAQRIGGGALRVGELRHGVIGIGRPRHRLRRQHQRLQRAFVDQSVDHAGRHAGLVRGLALGCAACRRRAARSTRRARRRHALRRRARRAARRPARAPARELAHAQRHAQHHAARASACSPTPSRRTCAAPACSGG